MIHHVYANKSNIGDWLSALGIQKLLQPRTVTEYLCDEPFVDETLRQLDLLNADDFIIIGGGGLFMDYFEPFWKGFEPIAQRVPFAIWGVGFVDLKQEDSRLATALLERILPLARVCRVRDDLTRRILSGAALPPPVPCPSMVAVKGAPLGGKCLLHAVNYTTVGAHAYEAMRQFGQDFAAQTGRGFRETNNRIHSGTESALQKILGLYQNSDIVLSSALHGCIVAVAMGRPVLAVSGDRKIEGFMAAAGLGEWVLDADQLDELPTLLSRVSTQTVSPGWLEFAIKENKAVAEQVLASCPAADDAALDPAGPALR